MIQEVVEAPGVGAVDVYVFTSPEEKQQGLSGQEKVPAGYYLFPYSGYPSRITTHQMGEAITVYELDRRMKVLAQTLMKPLRVMVVLPETVHVVETAVEMPRPTDFRFLKRYVR